MTSFDTILVLDSRLEAALTQVDTSPRTRPLEILLHEAFTPTAEAVTEVAA